MILEQARSVRRVMVDFPFEWSVVGSASARACRVQALEIG
jgi:hypothetical protein